MTSAPFPNRERIDARDKVRGVAAYAADQQLPGLLYAMTVPSPIAKGIMTALDIKPALAVPGVVRVLTPDDFPPYKPLPVGDLPGTPRPTLETQIAYRGQPVALVVAETLEAAIEGAEAVRPSFAPEAFAALVDSEGSQREPAEDVTAGMRRRRSPRPPRWSRRNTARLHSTTTPSSFSRRLRCGLTGG